MSLILFFLLCALANYMHRTFIVLVLIPHFSFLSPQSSVLSPQSSVLSLHSSFLIPHSSFLIPHSSFLIPHSSVLSPQSSVLSPQSSVLSAVFQVAAVLPVHCSWPGLPGHHCSPSQQSGKTSNVSTISTHISDRKIRVRNNL